MNSVLLQGDIVGDVFVVDNNSSDGTVRVVEDWLRTHGGENWHLLHQPVPGACAARNLPLPRVKDEWIQYLDADDELLANKLNHQIKHITPGTSVIAAKSEHRDENGRTWYSEPLHDVRLALVSGRLGNTCANLFSANIIRSVGGWTEGLSSSQEYDLMHRIWLTGAKFEFSGETATRIHERVSGRISTSNLRQKWLNHCDVQLRMLQSFELNEMDSDSRKPFLDAYFDRLRTLSYYDAQAAASRFEQLSHFRGFIPEAGGVNSKGYVRVFRLFGFKWAELMSGAVKWLKS